MRPRAINFATLTGRLEGLGPPLPGPKPIRPDQAAGLVAISKLILTSSDPEDDEHQARQVLGRDASAEAVLDYLAEWRAEARQIVAEHGTAEDLSEISRAIQTARCRRFLEKSCDGFPE